jgi:hypothetical protein
VQTAVLEHKHEMRAEAATRSRDVRHLWIYLTVRECGALSRGQVSRRLRREFVDLLRLPKRRTL